MSVSEDDIEKVFKLIDARRSEFIENLALAVSIPSVSGEPEHRKDCCAIGTLIGQILKDMGAIVEYAPIGYQTLPNGEKIELPPVLLATLGENPQKKTLLVYGHLDVQPAKKSDGWHSEPFSLTERDGKLFGRGSTDDKGPVLAWLHAISCILELKKELPLNLKFCFEAMEESGSEGLEELLVRRQDFLNNVDFVCISDNYWLGTKKPCLTYGLRGLSYYGVEVKCANQDLHSGTYGGGVPEAMNDVISIMSQLVDKSGKILIPGVNELVAPLTKDENKIYSNIDFCKTHFQSQIGAHGLLKETKKELLMNRWRYPSLSIHGIEGGFSGSGSKTVIPAKVIGKFSIRLVPHMTPESVDKLVVQYLNELWKERDSPNYFKVHVMSGGKPWVGNFRDDNFKAGVAAMQRVFGVEPDFTREGGSIPVTLTFQELTGKSVMLLPIGACDDIAHSQNEKLNISNYIDGTKVLASYIFELGII